jgi:hypothetical protein
MFSVRKVLGFALLALVVVSLSTVLVSAGDKVLSNNSGDASATWFITSEQTLVMNGFDLTPLGLNFPAALDKASIAVQSPVPGATIDIVVYQDANGGSPIDATLAGQTQVTINSSGTFTAVFPTPIAITQPVVWVGFYLPVDFKFLADKSGTSVLTYWAWTTGGRFNLASLSSAQVFGPSNGTAPVNLDLKGVARITAEISGALAGVNTSPGAPTAIIPTFFGTPAFSITQVASTSNQDLSVLRQYPPACDTLFWDTADVGVSYHGSIEPRCTSIWVGYAPSNPLGYVRHHVYYDLTFYDSKGNPLADPLPVPVTHCIQPSPEDLNTAVVGLASGSPRVFRILPTLRVGNLVCAEVDRSGGLSYFIPGYATVTPTFTPLPK